MMRYFFLLLLRHFPRKMGEDDQNPNTLRKFSSYKIGFKKSSSKRSKNTGGEGGSRSFGKFQTEADFFMGMASLSLNTPLEVHHYILT